MWVELMLVNSMREGVHVVVIGDFKPSEDVLPSLLGWLNCIEYVAVVQLKLQARGGRGCSECTGKCYKSLDWFGAILVSMLCNWSNSCMHFQLKLHNVFIWCLHILDMNPQSDDWIDIVYITYSIYVSSIPNRHGSVFFTIKLLHISVTIQVD